MKSTRSWLGAITIGIVVVGGWGVAQAGGSERRGRDGKYDDSRTSGGRENRNGGAWSGRDDLGGNGHQLNPRGDANGDLWPVIEDNTVAPHFSWVVWSRFNGSNYDLAWSHWKGIDWAPIRWVEPVRTVGNDLDPDLAFDLVGTPYLAWWRETDGRGEVFISVFMHGHWWNALRITVPELDARDPKIQVFGLGYIVVQYETPLGTMMQAARFQRPVTITDDINPIGGLRLVGESIVVDRFGQKMKK